MSSSLGFVTLVWCQVKIWQAAATEYNGRRMVRWPGPYRSPAPPHIQFLILVFWPKILSRTKARCATLNLQQASHNRDKAEVGLPISDIFTTAYLHRGANQPPTQHTKAERSWKITSENWLNLYSGRCLKEAGPAQWLSWLATSACSR